MKRAIRSRCSQGEMSFTCVCPRIFGDPWLLEKHLSWHSAISLAMLARGDSENRSSWLCSTDGSGKSRIPKPFLLTVLPILKQSEDVGSLQARTTDSFGAQLALSQSLPSAHRRHCRHGITFKLLPGTVLLSTFLPLTSPAKLDNSQDPYRKASRVLQGATQPQTLMSLSVGAVPLPRVCKPRLEQRPARLKCSMAGIQSWSLASQGV